VNGAIQAYKKVLSLDSSNEAAKRELARLESESKKTPSRSEDHGRQSSTKSSDASSRKWWILNIVLLLAQIFSIVHAVMVVFITNHYESKNAFGRAILAALFSFTGQALLNYGFPSFSTGKKLWKAFRGKASPAEIKDIANFAMDNNTHNIFYCSLTLSAAPSLCKLCFPDFSHIFSPLSMIILRCSVVDPTILRERHFSEQKIRAAYFFIAHLGACIEKWDICLHGQGSEP
jgi:hypothetical protein